MSAMSALGTVYHTCILGHASLRLSITKQNYQSDGAAANDLQDRQGVYHEVLWLFIDELIDASSRTATSPDTTSQVTLLFTPSMAVAEDGTQVVLPSYKVRPTLDLVHTAVLSQQESIFDDAAYTAPEF
ncbi:hypothetical protein I316_04326 [Kwoniella heveanensis BCC8398]|uniref:Uncharacterized protein n=1 Tax=Kwoniella heveanensis BCC8398 TaxID=1296120 RepID=A0A1B9GSD4_9TREE|nr:hypothetical protein I316_04326 [Kwoniella heveanensis BCC8398]